VRGARETVPTRGERHWDEWTRTRDLTKIKGKRTRREGAVKKNSSAEKKDEGEKKAWCTA